MGWEEIQRRQLAHHQLRSQQGPHFCPHSKAKVYRAFSPLVMVGVVSPILDAMVTVFYIMKE